ncbi:glycerol-3-phosphate responsive antiterminator [Brevibacterium zhoupengii]|uniref:glycerol-3-phosphate responsive antiterminator n=1 Tax=Brevibacterium zhoupengii TaxID=2898795 RepID=UPI001F088BDE|nr:glycerol-3-phosphate responsive antiterminator [Brevibacterium zhoupengii]
MDIAGLRRQRLERLAGLSNYPVVPAILDDSKIGPFTESSAIVCILAQFSITDLESTLERIHDKSDQLVFVNIDSIIGLAQDRGGVDFLAKIGADGVVTTRGSLISRGAEAGLITVQKLFVTDRSNLHRAVSAVKGAKADLLQIMPSPVLPFVVDHPVMRLRPVIAGGFIRDQADTARALEHGAIAVSVSSPELWNTGSANLGT